MADVVWLASYPKSGNTWVRVLLANALRQNTEPADINALGRWSIASSRELFDEAAGVEASALPDDLVLRLRPATYRYHARRETTTPWVKVHDAWRRLPDGQPLFPRDITAGAVYIVRNPLDVAVSYAHHWGLAGEEAVAALCNPAHTVSVSDHGVAEQLPQWLGTWSQHVRSWVDESGLPVHVVRYEDLLGDAAAVLAGLVGFLGHTVDSERLERAVAWSSFAQLQRQERERGFGEQSAAAPGRFFRRGQSGAWRDELPEPQVARLVAMHVDVMRRFGYVDGQGRPR